MVCKCNIMLRKWQVVDFAICSITGFYPNKLLGFNHWKIIARFVCHLAFKIQTWNDMNGCFGWDHMAFSKRRSTIVLWSAPAFLSPLFLSLTYTLFKHQNTETANETNPFIFVGSLYLVISYIPMPNYVVNFKSLA